MVSVFSPPLWIHGINAGCCISFTSARRQRQFFILHHRNQRHVNRLKVIQRRAISGLSVTSMVFNVSRSICPATKGPADSCRNQYCSKTGRQSTAIASFPFASCYLILPHSACGAQPPLRQSASPSGPTGVTMLPKAQPGHCL